MRETLRYAVAYRDEEGEYTETFFATYEEAKNAVEELSAYFEVYGILRWYLKIALLDSEDNRINL